MVRTVLSIPAGHPYPRAVQPDNGWDDFIVLPDPVIDPDDPKRWWPHPGFTADFWDGPEGDGIDLVHLHFGFEHLTPAQTTAFVDILRDRGIPLVFTVHDLDNPHLVDQGDYHQQLGILIRAAAEVFTLSEGAQAVVEKRYGRRPQLTAHPAIVTDPDRYVGTPGGRPAVFLKSVRANVVADPQFYRDLGAEIYIHHGADTGLEQLADHRHTPMDDDTLFRAVAAHRVVVLPYTRGTHSGWMRMCRDLGVSVAVPDCGCYDTQIPHDEGVAVYRTGDGRDAARVVDRLLAAHPVPPVPIPDAIDQHHRTYRALTGMPLGTQADTTAGAR